jgi:MoCo/4Fe-4S cofactor protein with predicted Tat translocation signal
MMNDPIVYWKSLDELRAEARRLAAERRQEFAEPLPWKADPARTLPSPAPSAVATASASGATRRDFLTLMGFSVGAVGAFGASACSRAPLQNALPFVREPEELVPGVANFYATTCAGCSAGCGLLVKVRDGRPIKIEGNPDSPLFGGGTCAVGQATVLSLYDDERLRGPRLLGKPATWDEIDTHVREGLKAAKASHRRVVLLSGTILGPTTLDVIARTGFEHVIYEPLSMSALRRAHQQAFGQAVVPHYRFDRASMIVGLDADFLGTWLSPVEFTHQYARRRQPARSMSRHVQFESGVSLTGANADERHIVAPSALGHVALALLERVRAIAGVARPDTNEPTLPVEASVLDTLATQLWAHRGESIIVCGAQDVATQIIVAALNHQLGNIGKTIELARPSRQKQADDQDIAKLIADMHRGEIGALLMYGVNPAYDYADAAAFATGLGRVPLTVSFADRLDETSARAQAVCPDHHFLEAWGDAEPIASYYGLAQPTIAPIFDTRAAQDSLLAWIGETPDFHAYLRARWQKEIFPRQQQEKNFDRFWDHALQTGVVDLGNDIADDVVMTKSLGVLNTNSLPSRLLAGARAPAFAADLDAAIVSVRTNQYLARADQPREREHDFELHLYETVGLRDGRHANNPWLQELPDPITKLTWGHAVAIAPAAAARLGLEDGDVVTVANEVRRIELPIVVQPGQSPATVSIALGYGRAQVGKVGRDVGVNAFPFMTIAAGGLRRASSLRVTLQKTGRREPLAATQTHHSMEGRPLIREASLRSFLVNASAGNDEDTSPESLPTLWAEHPTGRHFWGMAIDLNACTGCSACIVSCQAENNVPVVGKDEVRRGREMHWIRIDRYYSGPEASPETVFQPVMCQHCANAPCETVCPVLATVHSNDGLNQQVYNRCIGTRYCENNCPYKVRRFNWFTYAQNSRFDYVMNSPLETMVLNPDVVVRSRGVMEKCSLCIQRIQAGKLEAKKHNRELADGEIKTACQQACPAQAITFGDLHDANSVTAQLQHSPRHYHLLGGLGTRPTVGYLTKIRNREA